MSVLVKKLKSNSVEAYVKGAPEVMSDICDPSTREFGLVRAEVDCASLADTAACSSRGLR